MASKGSGFSYGLRKITQADRDLIQREIKDFNMPKTGDYVIDKMVNEKEVGYVAFSGKKIIGFVLLQQPGHGILRVDGLTETIIKTTFIFKKHQIIQKFGNG